MPYSITLNRGQTYQLLAFGLHEDLTELLIPNENAHTAYTSFLSASARRYTLFVAVLPDGAHSRWKTDGTAAGTTLVWHHAPRVRRRFGGRAAGVRRFRLFTTNPPRRPFGTGKRQ